ncbi:MAG TPA: MFS transporter [Anaeromyxobacter sp.]|nr:MFS transporter [Anaeromyxobacter sp.]
MPRRAAGSPAPPDLASPPSPLAAAGVARAALLALTLVNLLNYVDRFVVAALVESLKRSALALTDTQAGLLATAFIVVYAVASLAFGRLGDRGSRPRLLAAGVLLWSVATSLAGAARGFASLFAARAAVGVGEAAYGTISPGLIADLFPRASRGRALAVFYAAIPVGSALGYVVGGLADRALGWRAAFLVAGVPGLLLALPCARLADPPRGCHDEGAPAAPPASALSAYLGLARNRGYALTVLGYAAYTFAVGGMAFWMPAFLERVRGVPRAQATVLFGGVVVATGLVGTFVGGFLGDLLLRRTRQAYLWLSGAAALLAAPLAWLVFADPRPAVYLPAMVTAELLLFATTGPVNTAIVNAVPPEQRATAVAASILTIHALGDVPSPPLIGRLSDLGSLGQAVLVVPFAVLVAGAVWTLGACLGRRQGR